MSAARGADREDAAMAVELAELIGQLRAELTEAMRAGDREELRFELGPVELELTLAVSKEVKPGAKVRFLVVEVGADASVASNSTQRIKLTLDVRTVLYGTTGEVEAAAGRVRRLHSRMRASDPRTGEVYRIDEPDLPNWSVWIPTRSSARRPTWRHEVPTSGALAMRRQRRPRGVSHPGVVSAGRTRFSPVTG
jgi:hypothetical protein